MFLIVITFCCPLAVVLSSALVWWFKISARAQGYVHLNSRSPRYRLMIMRSSYFFSISAITWQDIQQLSLNLPGFTHFVPLMNWQNNSCKFVWKITQIIPKRITCTNSREFKRLEAFSVLFPHLNWYSMWP